MIGLVDYKCGNLGSVFNMISRLGYTPRVINSISDLEKSSFIVMPGVGNFAHGMKQIKALPYVDELLNRITVAQVPTLGICMGMQLLTEQSEEGDCAGLGLFGLKTIEFPAVGPLPHMGWAIVQPHADSSSEARSRFYFSHRFFVEFSNRYTTHSGHYNNQTFSAAIRKDNIIGCQFHPEKSHRFGMEFLGEVLGNRYE